METQPLLHYLSLALPAIPTQGTVPGPNTTDPHYDADDITQITAWPEFDYPSIVQQYGTVLSTQQIRPDPIIIPPAPIKDESVFHHRLVRRAFRAGFEDLSSKIRGQQQLSTITIDGGGYANIDDQLKADVALVVVGDSLETGVHRAPGDLKISWKWRSEMQFSENMLDRREYRQVLAQANFYMDQHNARYGFIVSEIELVAIKRLNKNGHLAVATPIPWKSGGGGQLSVLLGLWYIGMLAAEDNHWALE